MSYLAQSEKAALNLLLFLVQSQTNNWDLLKVCTSGLLD